MDADVRAMSRTIEALEALINAARPEEVAALVSPNATELEGEHILAAVQRRVDTLPEDTEYLIRSDISGGAVIPIAPETVRLQVAGFVEYGDRERHRELVSLEVESVEDATSRRWLLRTLTFSSQPTTLERTRSLAPMVLTLTAAGAVLVFVLLLVVRRVRGRR